MSQDADGAAGRLAALLDASSVEIAKGDAVAELCNQFQPGREVFVAYLPGDDYRARVAVAAELAGAGYVPVPHVPVREMAGRDALADFLARLSGEAGVDRILLIAGDGAHQRGPFSSTLSVLETGLVEAAGIRLVHMAGHPEGSAHMDVGRAVDALLAKEAAAGTAGLATGIVTQFSFDAAPILAWLDRLGAAGIRSPVRIGLAGPAGLATLIKFAIRCGVGNSLAALQKNAGRFGRLLTDTGPDDVVAGLAADPARFPGRVEAFHFFPFGGLAKTSAWMRRQGGR